MPQESVEPLPRSIETADRAVLLIDVAESVRLIEQDEAGFVSRWLRLVDDVRATLAGLDDGRLVKTMGDGMLLDFGNVRAAVSTAFAIQEASERLDRGIAPERRVRLRMGLTVSTLLVEGSDVFGRGVNLAARLMTLAAPGEIVISTDARDQLTTELDADVEDLGDCYVRHLRDPVRAYRVRRPGQEVTRTPTILLEDLAPAIAVLPFSARSITPEHQVLGEVLAEEIIRTLSRSPELNVLSRLSTRAFAGRNADLDEIGRHLKANYVLSGTYSTDHQRLRVEGELAEVGSGRVLWTGSVDDHVGGILSGDQEVVRRLAAEVGAMVMKREVQRATSQPLPTLKAYSLLMGAITLMYRFSPADFEQSRAMLETLISRGSRQPTSHAWLANWHVLRVQQGWSVDDRKDAHLALENTKRALDADPKCSLALAIDGFVHTNLMKELDVAMERYDLAIEVNPSDSLAWGLKGTLHAFQGQGEAAVADTQRALQLTPLHPYRFFYDLLAAGACLSARQYDRTVELAKASLRVNRKHTSTLRTLAVAQWGLGLQEEARETARELMQLQPGLTVSGWIAQSPGAKSSVGQEVAEVLRAVGVPA